MRAWLSVPLLVASMSAQEMLWQAYSLHDAYLGIAPSFGDFDGDGYDDVLTVCLANYNIPIQEYPAIRILSGRDGSILQDRNAQFTVIKLSGIGDFDRDGFPDYLVGLGGAGFAVWSPRLQRALLPLAPPPEIYEVVMGGGDLDGDLLPDIVLASSFSAAANVHAFDHRGNLRYTVPILQYGIARGGAFVGDIDGDRCDDFVIGIDWYDNLRGALAVFSGRTGAIIRFTPGELPGDRICYPLAAVGDLDRDGLTDYMVGNYFGQSGRSLINVYSGASGAIVRQWVSTTVGIGANLLPGPDVDLDGLPDVISGTSGFVNPSTRRGRLQVFSSRDQQVVMHTEATGIYTRSYARWIADLGVQPGSPYPVVAFTDDPQPIEPYRRIQAWRLAPPGAHVTGTGCSSAGVPPAIGVRRVTTALGESSRITLGSDLPSWFAWCAIDAAIAPAAPLPLAPFGFPGCNLLVPPCLVAARTTGAAGFDRGYAAVDLPDRLPTLLVDERAPALAAQWVLFDPMTLGFAATPRHEIVFW